MKVVHAKKNQNTKKNEKTMTQMKGTYMNEWMQKERSLKGLHAKVAGHNVEFP